MGSCLCGPSKATRIDIVLNKGEYEPIEKEPECTKRGVNFSLPSEKVSQILEHIEENGCYSRSFLPEIKTFLENDYGHRCSRMVINKDTLEVRYTAPNKHKIMFRSKRIICPYPAKFNYEEHNKKENLPRILEHIPYDVAISPFNFREALVANHNYISIASCKNNLCVGKKRNRQYGNRSVHFVDG